MIPLEMRSRTPAEDEQRRRALAAAEGVEPAADDAVARVWTWAAGLLGLALVVALLWR